MATLNWKTPNGTTGNLNLGNIVTTNTNQTISGAKTFITNTLNTLLIGDSNNYINHISGTLTSGDGKSKSYPILRSSLTDTYVRSSLRTLGDGSANGCELWLELARNNSTFRMYHTETGSSKYTVDNDAVLTDRAFVGAQGGVQASNIRLNNGYIYFKNGLLIQWSEGNPIYNIDDSVYTVYLPYFPLFFSRLFVCFGFNPNGGTTITTKSVEHSVSWFPEASGEGTTDINYTNFVCSSDVMAALYFIGIGRADSI